jgi:multidrug efflux pump subunit AcrA (membrane-fusion protein)
MKPAHRITVCLLITLSAVGCRGEHESKQEESKSEAGQPVKVAMAPVTKGAIREQLDAAGETQALKVLRLASPVAGRITELASLPGDHIARSAVAARVIPLESDAALRGFEVLRDADGNRANDTRQLARELAARDLPIRAPFGAVVSERLHNPGEQVAQGEVLLEIFDPGSLHVVAQVPADRASSLVGKPAEISGSGVKASGKVEAVLPSVAAQSLTVPVRLSIDPLPDTPLLHAPVTCRITAASHEDVLLVPRAALVTALVSNGAEVMVAKEGHARRRKISVGLTSDTVVEALDGLAAGEMIITEGGYALPEGAAVEAAKESAE